MPLGGGGGQVLERVHGHVDLAREQGVAQGADEDAGAADLGQRPAVDVALGGDLDQLDLAAQPGRGPVGDQSRTGWWRERPTHGCRGAGCRDRCSAGSVGSRGGARPGDRVDGLGVEGEQLGERGGVGDGAGLVRPAP